MPRRIPPDRLTDIGRAACGVFTEKGYRGALMSDVAGALGLSHGLLYRYVESKGALFALAVRYATDPGSVGDLELPVPTPAPSETISAISGWLHQRRLPLLLRANRIEQADDIRAEFGSIIEEHYDVIEQSRLILALLERCAADLPDLHSVYFVRRRRGVQDTLTSYLGRRVEAGQMRPVPDVAVAARFVIEGITWFAWHRKNDPDSSMIDDDTARRTVRYLLLQAFCAEGR